MKKIFTLISIFTLTMAVNAQNPNLHIYLCIGQSNMEGSAAIEEQDKTAPWRLYMMPTAEDSTKLESARRMGEWYAATPPLSQPYSGLSPADYFGRTLVERLPNKISVGLISVAIGGSDIRIFDKDKYLDYRNTYNEDWFINKVNGYGGSPYHRLIETARKAQKDGVIKGIILHQGETNEGNAEWPEYVKTVYSNILSDLGLKAKNVPLIAGQVVPESANGVCASMNEIIVTLPEVIPTAYVVSSEGCGVQEDNVHFNSEGVRELGRRYAEKMIEVKGYKVKE